MPSWEVIQGDCRAVMAGMDAESVDAICTDPPYGLGFMGKDWDHGVPGEHFWTEALRVAKPGAHLLAFGGTRTEHRLTCAIEDAGWEIRDKLCWLTGSGFPKSLNVSKAIDNAAGVEPVESPHPTNACPGGRWCKCDTDNGRFSATKHPPHYEYATDAARQWEGWGTALKPAIEYIVLARKPLRGTVAANVQACGCGALNIDASRIEGNGEPVQCQSGHGGQPFGEHDHPITPREYSHAGRWPSNLLLDESAAAMLDEAVGERVTGGTCSIGSGSGTPEFYRTHNGFGGIATSAYDDTGGPSRFFARFHYSGKTTKSDRNEGCGGSNHPCVKPTDLMRWLVKLITPPGGTVLDPFTGSGSTGKACAIEGFNFIGIELDPEYAETARTRIAEASNHLFANVTAWA